MNTATIDGREYEFSQPTVEDWEWWVAQMRGEFIAAGRASISDDAPPDELEAIRLQAMKLWQPHLIGWFKTTSGLAREIYRLLKTKQPDVTVAKVTEWIMEGKLGRGIADEQIDASIPDRKGDGGPDAGNG